MSHQSPDILVLREGEEGLSMRTYCNEIQKRLPSHNVKLAETPKQECELARNVPIITGGSLRSNILEEATALRLFAGTTSGYGHLPIDKLKNQNVAVTNASGIHAPGIAEQTIGNILVFARNMHKGWQQKQTNQWNHYQADELQNSTVTIIGLGSIGSAVATRLQGFDVKTIGVRYTPKKGGPTDEVYGFTENEIHTALAQTDYLVLSCPLTDETKHLIDEQALVTLPPDSVIINAARGGIIDTPSLVEALQTGKIKAAALDVTDPEPLPPDHPLWTLDNVLITPHMGGHTPKHWPRLADILEDNITMIEDSGCYDNLRNQVI